MESIKSGAQYVQEKVQGTGAEASKEANKTTAEDSNVNLTTRATAAKDAVGDKIDESKHDNKSEIHKQKATH